MNCLRPLEHWGRGFESHSRHRCLPMFILCLCFPVQVAALRRADPPSKESYRLSKNEETEVKRSVSRDALCSRGSDRNMNESVRFGGSIRGQGTSQWARGLRPLGYWGRAFESHLRHGCLCAFILCVGSGLATR
jgi:hypothetical protein